MKGSCRADLDILSLGADRAVRRLALSEGELRICVREPSRWRCGRQQIEHAYNEA